MKERDWTDLSVFDVRPQILGEGSFAEVKLLVNRETGEACAMKEIDLNSHPDQVRRRQDFCKPFPAANSSGKNFPIG